MFGDCDARRRQALRGAGLDPDLAMIRAASNANEVWIGDELVVRINSTGAGRLAREATVAARAPREALVPPIVELGHDGALEWSISRRASGGELGRQWKTMTPALRERAIDELAGALAALHATPTAGLDAPELAPPHTLPLEPLRALIDELAAAHPEHEAQLAACDAFVTARWSAFDDADRGLAHGDPHLENVLWNGVHVTALLDLEWARPTCRSGSRRRITKRPSSVQITPTSRAGFGRRIPGCSRIRGSTSGSRCCACRASSGCGATIRARTRRSACSQW
jgi:hypothetical protein